LRPLLAAWAKEGIPALLFKGFALAEFEYATPGERFYGDVDILLPQDPATVARAFQLALAYGWRSDSLHTTPEYWTHESGHLYQQHTRIDVHRFALGWSIGTPQRHVHALTRSVWERAQQVDWDGIPIWRPHPHDALVVNLALARQWGNNIGLLKPADYPDARRLIEHYNLTPDALETRAKELRGEHTWTAFRQFCDPWKRHFALDQDLSEQLLAAARRDGKHTRAHFWQSQVRLLPRRLRRIRWLFRLLPDAVAAWHAVRTGKDPRLHLARWTPTFPQVHPSPTTITEVVATAQKLTRLLYPKQSRVGTCVPRAYITYRALRRFGYPAVFVSGVIRTSEGIQGHAWVEDPHGLMEAYGEPLNRLRYKELLRYPKE